MKGHDITFMKKKKKKKSQSCEQIRIIVKDLNRELIARYALAVTTELFFSLKANIKMFKDHYDCRQDAVTDALIYFFCGNKGSQHK